MSDRKMKNPPKMTANEVFGKLVNMTTNLLLSRSSGFGGCGNVLDGSRNLDRECNFIEGEPTLVQYRAMYDEEGVATRIVGFLPDECWSVYPELYETEDKRKTAFERAWDRFVKAHNPWYYLHLLDERSGIGRFGVMLIGLNDGLPLDRPAAGIMANGRRADGYVAPKPAEVIFLRVFSEETVTIVETETDWSNPRYGLPVMYELKLSDPNYEVAGEEVVDKLVQQSVRVHWTRIHHQVPERTNHPFLGPPRLRNLHRRVFNIRKILGSAGEMFYKGGFPGISFETFPEITADADLDLDSVKKDIEAYSAGLQRYIRLIGMTAKSLAPQVADPTNHLLQEYTYICATLRAPIRVFMGAEAGDKASSQYAVDWNRRLSGRQKLFLEPMSINPFVDRLILLGVLPEPEGYITSWRDLNALSDKDRADVALKRAQAILQYVTSGTSKFVRPRHFLTLVLGFTEQEAKSIVDAAGGEEALLKEMENLAQATAGNTPATSGTNPTQKTGAGGRRNGLGGTRRKTNV